MDEIVKPKKRKPSIERIPIGVECLARIDGWLTELESKNPGIRLKRGDLVEWLLLNRPSHLTEAEGTSLGEKYYDQLDLAYWILRELKLAKSSGEKLSIAQIMQRDK